MLELGESGRFEFKSESDAVSPALLAALANWAALDGPGTVAHLLIGVDEETDEATGLVRGVPCRLKRGLDRAISRVQDQASNTRPIPVDVFIIEEGTETTTPFVRVEVRPTMAPHHDDQGRRQTRQGRSTRALSDDEMLRIYLDREAGSFAKRFRQTSEELHAAVGAVGSQVDQISAAIDEKIAGPVAALTETSEEAAEAASLASLSASSAEGAVSLVDYEVSTLRRAVGDVQNLVEDLKKNSPASLAARVVNSRRIVWWHFTADTYERTSKAADRLTAFVRALLSRDVSIEDARNSWELDVWSDLVRRRQELREERGTLKWWKEEMEQVAAYFTEPVYRAPDLPDLRSELQADVDAALDDPGSLTRRFTALIRET
jgi:hypothetical protein